MIGVEQRVSRVVGTLRRDSFLPPSTGFVYFSSLSVTLMLSPVPYHHHLAIERDWMKGAFKMGMAILQLRLFLYYSPPAWVVRRSISSALSGALLRS